jgi:hypothetical protein
MVFLGLPALMMTPTIASTARLALTTTPAVIVSGAL